jgi:two-component system chemotaxis response regulator CheB
MSRKWKKTSELRRGSPADCGGAIWEIENAKLTRYRCHVGHQYTPEGFDAQQREAVEAALWTAVRVLEERSELRTRMARRAEESGMANVAQNFLETAGEAEQQAHTIRELLFGRAQPAPAPTARDATARRKPKAQAQRQRR